MFVASDDSPLSLVSVPRLAAVDTELEQREPSGLHECNRHKSVGHAFHLDIAPAQIEVPVAHAKLCSGLEVDIPTRSGVLASPHAYELGCRKPGIAVDPVHTI